MIAQRYAEALHRAITNASADRHDALIKNFTDILKEHGHLRLLPAILREYEKLTGKEEHRNAAVITVARRDDATRLQEQIERDLERLGVVAASRRIEIDPTLVGGYRVSAFGRRVDASYKKQLLDLYATLTA